MQANPVWSLAMVCVFAVMAASNWRRTRIRRMARDLPTALRRRLGEAPEYEAPDEEAFRDYTARHRRLTRVMHVAWGLAALWLVYVGYLALGAG